MSYLITPSLYYSYWYYKETDFDGVYIDADSAKKAEEKALADWLNTLNKVKTLPTPAMQAGIDFENAVYEMDVNFSHITEDEEGTPYLNGEKILYPAAYALKEEERKCAYDFAKIVNGGIWQYSLIKKEGNFTLYGRADVIKGNTIYDIKRVSSYDVGKYQESIQHLLYMECSSLEHFRYLICDGKNTYEEYYGKDAGTHDILMGKINTMVDWINSVPEFAKPFNKYWIARD